jgi:hypothetical protein
MSYIIVAKPNDHKQLFQHAHELETLGYGGNLELTDDKGRIHRYRWVNQVPLNGSKNADDVNFFQYELVNKGKVTYKNSWVTDITIDEHNVVDLVKNRK